MWVHKKNKIKKILIYPHLTEIKNLFKFEIIDMKDDFFKLLSFFLEYGFKNFNFKDSEDVDSSVMTNFNVNFLEFLEKKNIDKKIVCCVLRWIFKLIEKQILYKNFKKTNAARFFTEEEKKNIGIDACDIILYLEQNKILTPKTREIVIEQLVNFKEIYSFDELKVIISFVIMTQYANLAGIEKLFQKIIDQEKE